MENLIEVDGVLHHVWESAAAIHASMHWEHGIDIMRANPSPLFWQAWHADKASMKKLGYKVYKTPRGWAVFVGDPSLIHLLASRRPRRQFSEQTSQAAASG